MKALKESFARRTSSHHGEHDKVEQFSPRENLASVRIFFENSHYTFLCEKCRRWNSLQSLRCYISL